VISTCAGVAALIAVPILVLHVMAATVDDENIVLAHNDVVTDAAGTRT
jgi:hypothetical protein